MEQTRLFGRAVIRISATDEAENIREFLQGLVTQDMDLVQRGAPQWSALLSAQGKLLFDFFLWSDDADILIDCEKLQVEALIKRLKLYRLRRKIGIEIDHNRTVHWGQKADGKPADPRLPALGHRWLSSLKNGGEDENGADGTYRARRLSLGVTEGQVELGSDKILWLECNAAELNGVSFTKGCYIGQENTARMNYRKKVNRRMVVAPLAQADQNRQRVAYPELGLSVEHRRTDALEALDIPKWLQPVL